jgi:hypothetical protein
MLASHQRLTVRTKLLLVILLLTLCSAVAAYIAHVVRKAVGNVDSSHAVAEDVESASAGPSSDPPREMLTTPATADALQTAVEAPEPQPLSSDQRYRQLVVGTWEDDYQGKRTMTLKEDGTGTMLVELSGMQATLFASRLEFDMVWSLENGRLKKHTVGGRPETRVNMILKMMGDRVDEPVLELTPDRLLLLDKDGETRYDWRRKK